MMILEVQNISALSKVTAHLITLMEHYKIFLLKGDLGAGKTTLVKQWMNDIGIVENVSSPTFSIINEYRNTERSVFHMDMYRLKEIDEALNIGIEEYIYESGSYNIIEWPGLIMNLIDDAYVLINISVTEEQRTFTITEHQVEDKRS